MVSTSITEGFHFFSQPINQQVIWSCTCNDWARVSINSWFVDKFYSWCTEGS